VFFCLARFCIALERRGPVRADVVVANPEFTDHHQVTLHKFVNIDHLDVAGKLGRRARASVTTTHASTAAAWFGDRVTPSTGAGADR
jgi:hypothetical protein